MPRPVSGLYLQLQTVLAIPENHRCRASLVSAVFRNHFQNPTTPTPLAFRKDAATLLPDRPQQSRSQDCNPTASVDVV